jgi:guanylate kinase
MILDRDGAQRVKAVIPETVTIWIWTELDSLKERLQQRGTESLEQIATRLKLAAKEFEQEKQLSLFHYHIKNDKIDDAFYDFKTILIKFLNFSSSFECSRKSSFGDESGKKL